MILIMIMGQLEWEIFGFPVTVFKKLFECNWKLCNTNVVFVILTTENLKFIMPNITHTFFGSTHFYIQVLWY